MVILRRAKGRKGQLTIRIDLDALFQLPIYRASKSDAELKRAFAVGKVLDGTRVHD